MARCENWQRQSLAYGSAQSGGSQRLVKAAVCGRCQSEGPVEKASIQPAPRLGRNRAPIVCPSCQSA